MRKNEPGLLVALAIWTLVTGLTPIAVLIAMSYVVGDVPSAASHGLSSPDGHRLILALVVFGFLFALSLFEGPSQTALQMLSKVRLTFHLQSRLMRAVNTPVGIEHLEDSKILDQLNLAQGAFMSFAPADAPMTLASATSSQIQGLVACAVIGTFRWWMGVVFAIVWMIVRHQFHGAAKLNVRSYSGNAGLMRRATYFNGVATGPAVAKELRIFGLGSWVVDHVKHHWTEGMERSFTNNAKSRRALLESGIEASVVYVASFLYLARVAYVGHADLHTVALVLSMMAQSYFLAGLTPDSQRLNWQLNAFPHLDDLESSLLSHAGENHGSRMPVGYPSREIRFESLSFHYPDSGTEIFRDLNLTIPAGRSTAIVGINGAGKTTLVKLLSRLHEPVAGRILVDDVPLTDFDPRAWQRRIAVVFQDFNHYPISARDNIAFGSIEQSSDLAAITLAATRAGAIDVIEGLATGWHNVLSKDFSGGTDLSGGQWQRVALARALFAAQCGAGVLVLDEPTSWMDVRGEAAFYEQFLDLTHGLTTVVISHRFSTVRLADQICVIEDGRVSESGNHDELIALDGTYSSMFHLQAARFVDGIVDGHTS